MATSGNGRPEQRLGTTLSDRGLIARGGFQGRAYIFLRRWGGNGFGHAGWGYQIGNDGVTCGSMENGAGSFNVGYHELNNAWYQFNLGVEDMLGVMRGGFGKPDLTPQSYGGDPVLKKGKYLPPPHPFTESQISIRRTLADGGTKVDSFDVWRYTEYAWIDVSNPRVEKADKLALESPNIGYNAAGNNCLDLTYRIVEAYGVPGNKLPWTQNNAYPSTWFDQCVSDKGWHRVRWPDMPA
jgi:hypothetical protein